jgi:SAM-dependent methyltransferase
MDTATETSAFEAFEAAGWQQRATGYDAFFSPITVRTIDSLLDAARIGTGTRVLDVGTGPGHVAGRAADRGALATGIDIAEAMVDIARATWPRATFRAADAHELPFPTSSFDAVIGNFAILHLGRPERAVEEFVRVLAPRGRVALTTWDEPHSSPLLGAVAAALEACGARPPTDIPAGPPFFRFSDDAQFRGLLESAGLVDVTVETLGFTHSTDDAETVWAGIVNGTVRTSALILRQPTELQRHIRDAFIEILTTYRRDATIDLPVSVKLAAGTRRRPVEARGR